jgi:hypothetical protein
MKRLITTALTIFVLALPTSVTLAQSKPSYQSILDSLEILKNVGGFIDGHSYPPTVEETRYNNIVMMLFWLSFSETKKLLSDKNKFTRCYGFLVSTKIHFDSLTNADLEVFKDTSSLPLYTQRGIIDVGITLGKYCEMAYYSTVKEQETKAKQPVVIAAIKSFIKDYAKFPKSYEPINFEDFTWMGSDNDITFEIKHLYKIKQNDGKSVSIQDFFILDKDLKIMLIETIRSRTIKVDPPRIDEWLKVYGRN